MKSCSECERLRIALGWFAADFSPAELPEGEVRITKIVQHKARSVLLDVYDPNEVELLWRLRHE